MYQVVSCPHCDGPSKVPANAIGQMVACPRCDQAFTATARRPVAISRSRIVPVVSPAKPVAEDQHAFAEPIAAAPISVLFGLALLPFGIPMLWVLLPMLTGKTPVFTFALPISIALAAAGLSAGVVFAADWSFATRLKAIFALIFLSYGTAALLFFLKAEWVEAVRRDLGRDVGAWVEFTPADKAYVVRMPGPPKDDKSAVISGWPLTAFRYVDRKDHNDAYVTAHGRPPAAAPGSTDDQFFDAAKTGAVQAADGTLISERAIIQQGHPGREYVFTLADNATTRTLRVYRAGGRAVVAVAEGAFLPPDAKDVRRFFDSLRIAGGK